MFHKYPWLIAIKDSFLQLINGILIPTLFFVKNEEARKHVKINFWEIAPECLHNFNPNRVYEINV